MNASKINHFLGLFSITNIGFAVVQTGDEQQVCFRTRQDIPVDVIKKSAWDMILTDPKSLAPTGNNDLPYAFVAQVTEKGKVKNVIALHNDKVQIRTLAFNGGICLAMTTTGKLLMSNQVSEAIKQGDQNRLEFGEVTIEGLSQDTRITDIVAIQEAEQTKLYLGATGTYPMYVGHIDRKDRKVHVKPIQAPIYGVTGIRVNLDEQTIAIANVEGKVWSSSLKGDLDFQFLAQVKQVQGYTKYPITDQDQPVQDQPRN